MALKFGELYADIGANTSGLRRADRAVSRTTKNMSSSFMSLGRVIGAVLTGVVVKNTVLLADKMNMLDQQIRNVTKNAESFKKIRNSIRDIAGETGNSIESVTRLSQALIIAGESIGATDDQVIEMTSNLNKLGVIGGSTGEAMSNSMRQFGQAMAGGVVRAEEFNSIIENTPLIAKAIADGMGLTTGELRKQVIAGTVLSEEVFRALEGQTESINAKFAAMPLTVDRAAGMMANSFATAMQELDNGFGITEDIANGIKAISDKVGTDLIPVIDDIIDGFIEFIDLIDESTGASQDLINKHTDFVGVWDLVKIAASSFMTLIQTFPTIVQNATTIALGEFDKLWSRTIASFGQFTAYIEFGLVSAFNIAITNIRVAWDNFIAHGQRGLANIFEFLGADDIADSINQTAASTVEAGAELTAALAEQQAERETKLEEEITSIETNLEAKLVAVDAIIVAGFKETESLTKQVAERTKIRKRERADRRKNNKEQTAETGKITKVLEKSNAEKLKDMKAYGQASDTLAAAGIISDKANALIQIGISAATAVAKTSELGFPQALPFIAMALANIVNAKQMLSGAGRQFGGSASGGMPIPINEGGPEMFTNNAGRQFLLPDKSGNITPLNATGGGGGGMPNIIINNNAPGVEIETRMSDGELIFMINEAERNAVENVNASLASGRGESAEALRSGFTQSRNI